MWLGHPRGHLVFRTPRLPLRTFCVSYCVETTGQIDDLRWVEIYGSAAGQAAATTVFTGAGRGVPVWLGGGQGLAISLAFGSGSRRGFQWDRQLR